MVSLGNSAGKEQKHWETSPHMPSTAARRMRQSVTSLPPCAHCCGTGELLVGMELPGELLVVHWCLRGHRERNCCKGRLQRDISGISRFRQLQKNNQREKTLK